MPYDLFVEIRHEEVLVIDHGAEIENEEDEDELVTQEAFDATPVYCYRRQLEGTTQVQIGFDPENYNVVHIVFIKYCEVDGQNNAYLRWAIAEILPSRRSAKIVAEEIENNEWRGDGPWMHDNCDIEEVEIYSLGVED
jgi:hypothetical protein